MSNTRPLTVALAATLAFSACDLPTTAEEARDHLGRNQEERIVPIQLPLPEISVTLADQLGELSGIVDTTDLSFSVDPDTFAFGLDSLLSLDPVDPDPVVQGYDLSIAPFTQDINATIPSVPISLPGSPEQQLPLPGPPLPPVSGSETIPFTLDAFATATFATGSELRVILTTDGASTVDGVEAYVDDGGVRLADSGAPVNIPASTTDTLVIALGGVTLPSAFDLVLSFTAGEGDGTVGNLTFSSEFGNAAVDGATGVDPSLITPVSFTDTVSLDVSGPDFSQAVMDSGTIAVESYSIGTLELDATFTPADLSGLQVGGATPDNIIVEGVVGPPAGATTVDIDNSASLTLGFSGLKVRSVTLNTVSMSVDQAVTVPTDSTLDNLERVEIESGTLQVDVINRLGVGGPVTLTLTGLTDAGGSTLVSTIDLAASPDGSPVTTVASIDLAGAVLDPAALAPQVAGTISGTNVTVTATAAAEAVTVDPYIEIQPRRVVLSGVPDLSVSLDERVSISTADIDLGELGDLIDKISFNDVSFTVTVDNGTGLDIQVAGFAMTLLDAGGIPVTDGLGDTARVALDDGTGSVTAAANTATVVTGEAAAFVNALLDRVAAGEDVEVAAGGTVGPAADSGSIALGDTVAVIFEIHLGPDISIDPSGITLDQVVAEALELDSVASEFMADLSEDLLSAGVEFEVLNAMPLGLSVTMALAPTPADTVGWDPFLDPDRLELPPFTVDPAGVDAEGRVDTPVTSTPDVTVANPSELGILAEQLLGLGLRAEIVGPAGGRARLQPTDSLVIRPLLKIEVRVGGNGGTL